MSWQTGWRLRDAPMPLPTHLFADIAAAVWASVWSSTFVHICQTRTCLSWIRTCSICLCDSGVHLHIQSITQKHVHINRLLQTVIDVNAIINTLPDAIRFYNDFTWFCMILADAIGNNGNRRCLISRPAPETVAEAPLPPPPGQLGTAGNSATLCLANLQWKSEALVFLRESHVCFDNVLGDILDSVTWRDAVNFETQALWDLRTLLLRPSGTPPRSGTAPMIIVFTSVERMHNLKCRVKVELPCKGLQASGKGSNHRLECGDGGYLTVDRQ